LQLLWRDQQNNLEKVTDQKSSLQKLNQELSITINDYRREIRELKERLDSETQTSAAFKVESEQKAKALAQVNARTSSASGENGQNADGSDKPTIKREDRITPEIMAKIDKVLTNLHVGR
jgi:predicted RNase H-like nuclease (RuvC/YqgF family)